MPSQKANSYEIPGHDYGISYEDYGLTLLKSGRELLAGLAVKLPEAPASLLIKYRLVR